MQRHSVFLVAAYGMTLTLAGSEVESMKSVQSDHGPGAWFSNLRGALQPSHDAEPPKLSANHRSKQLARKNLEREVGSEEDPTSDFRILDLGDRLDDSAVGQGGGKRGGAHQQPSRAGARPSTGAGDTRLNRHADQALSRADEATWSQLMPASASLVVKRRSCEKLLTDQVDIAETLIDEVDAAQEEIKGLQANKLAVKELHKSNQVLKQILQSVEGQPLAENSEFNVSAITTAYTFVPDLAQELVKHRSKYELNHINSANIVTLRMQVSENELKGKFMNMFKEVRRVQSQLKMQKTWLQKQKQELEEGRKELIVERGQLAEIRLRLVHRLHNLQHLLRSLDTDVSDAELKTEPKIVMPSLV